MSGRRLAPDDLGGDAALDPKQHPPGEEHFPPPQEIAEQHSALRIILGWLETDLERQCASPEGIQVDGPLLGPLRSLREHLAAHFDLEETSQVLGPAILALPDGAAALENWTTTHRELLTRLDACLSVLEAGTHGRPLPDSFAPELRAFFDSLRAHDAYESDVLGTSSTTIERITSERAPDAN
jgi:hypothetical protein